MMKIEKGMKLRVRKGKKLDTLHKEGVTLVAGDTLTVARECRYSGGGWVCDSDKWTTKGYHIVITDRLIESCELADGTDEVKFEVGQEIEFLASRDVPDVLGFEGKLAVKNNTYTIDSINGEKIYLKGTFKTNKDFTTVDTLYFWKSQLVFIIENDCHARIVDPKAEVEKQKKAAEERLVKAAQNMADAFEAFQKAHKEYYEKI